MSNYIPVNVADLLRRATNRNILVSREENDLKVQVKKGEKIDQLLLLELKQSKQDILNYIRDKEDYENSKASFLKKRGLPSRPVEEESYYDISHQQEKEYLRFLITGKNTSNLRFKIPFKNADRRILERVINTLFQRHESLRTNFQRINGVSKQVVREHKEGQLPIEYIDLSQDEQRIAEVQRELDNISFDFQRGPLACIKIVSLPGNMSVLVFVIHHAISDAGSIELLKKEIDILYDAYSRNRENPLPPPKLQYKDYSFWISNLLGSQEGEKFRTMYGKKILESMAKQCRENEVAGGIRRSYKKELEEQMKALQQGKDLPGYAEAVGTIVTLAPGSGASYTAFIGEGLADKLRNLAVRYSSSLFIIFIAAFALLFFKRNKRNFRISIPFSTRIFKEFEDIVGWLTHNLIVCIEINEGLNVGEFIRSVNDLIWESSDFRFYPHEMIMKDLDIPLNVLAPVYINLLRTGDYQINDFSPFHSDKASGLLDLKCIVCECRNGVIVKMTYNKEKYSRDEIEHISGQYLSVLENMVDCQTTSLPDL